MGLRSMWKWMLSLSSVMALLLSNPWMTEGLSLFLHTFCIIRLRRKGYISAGWSLDEQCRVMPVVDNYGNVTKTRKKILGSKWVGLMGKNPWRGENYIELGVDYKSSGCFAGNYTSEELKQIGVKVVKWILGEWGKRSLSKIVKKYPPLCVGLVWHD